MRITADTLPKGRFTLLVALSLFSIQGVAGETSLRYEKSRKAMVATIEEDVRETSVYLDKETLDPRILSVLGKVPRHEFVPASQQAYAYENRPLPIGHGQTISQPYIVAIMTDLLKPEQDERILEVGTGSGYQAAVLAKLVKEVYSIEIIAPLARQAESTLQRLGYTNARVMNADGYYGWQENAPFDAIIVTAAANHVPPPLIQQLKPGGRMVIPVGTHFLVQQLVLVKKDSNGDLTTRQILPVMFVPLTGGH